MPLLEGCNGMAARWPARTGPDARPAVRLIFQAVPSAYGLRAQGSGPIHPPSSGRDPATTWTAYHGAVVRLPDLTAVGRLIVVLASPPTRQVPLPQVTCDRLIIFTSNRCVGWPLITYLDMVCTYMSTSVLTIRWHPGRPPLPCPQHGLKHPSVRSRR